jgi:hypothetical protein
MRIRDVETAGNLMSGYEALRDREGAHIYYYTILKS